MANLEFCDKHNMVAYLKKPTGSVGFQEIVDFLNESHIKFALTKNPTIYVSLIEKFWQTATVKIVDNGEQEITATVDGKEFTITKALDGNMKKVFSGEHTPLFLSMLEIQAEEGKGSGHPSESQPPPSTAQPIHKEPIPNVVSSSHQKTQTPRQALNQVTELPQSSEPIPNVGIGAGGSPRCQDATRGSIAQTSSDRVPIQPYDSPLPRVNTLGSDEGSMQLQELMALCTKFSDRVLALETDLRQTKKVYSVAYYTKLIMKGRMIEEIDQDAGVTLVTPTHSQEDQPKDQLGVFCAAKILADAAKNVHTYTRRRRVVSTGSGGVSIGSRLFSTAEESVSSAGASMPVSTTGTVQEVNKDKAAVRLQEQLDEEERQRIARVHEEARSFNIKEWEDIQATIEADEELAQRIQAEEREKYFEAEKARLLAELINQRKRYFAQQRAKERRNKPLTQAQQRTYMSNYIKHMGSHTL
ncbi:hypothetical protein Tco_1224085 [Tanacetum coccineum]